ncbi:MAG: 3-deoxy-7-phosphoheptulonate synthase [Patescibacteria group bacterium]
MIIVMEQKATKTMANKIIGKVKKAGLKPVLLEGTERFVIAVIGDERKLSEKNIRAMEGVERTMLVVAPYKLASKENKPQSIVKVNGCKIGGKKLAIMAGPCSIESLANTMQIARATKKAGATILRGGAFKPRTSPYAFQGMGEEGLKIMQIVKELTNMPIITEVLDTRKVELVAKYADIIQIGARNMQNFELLKEVGKTKKPVLLKRGLSSTIDEFLMSAEYIMSEGNGNVILCERGIRAFDKATRFVLDISAVPVLKQKTHLPVIVDPSHAAGDRRYVSALARAAIAAGADGLIVEVHPEPKRALSDGDQTLNFPLFNKLMREIKLIAKAIGREV